METKQYPEVQFVTSVIEQLTGETDFTVDRKIDQKGVLLTVDGSDEMKAKIIGKKGRNATAIRTLLRQLGMRHNAFYSLKIEAAAEQSGTEEATAQPAE